MKDYDNSVKTLRKQKRLWSPDLFKEAINITIDFFSTDYFRKLPTEIFREILLMIPTNEYCNLFAINTEWCDVGLSDETWSLLYQRKFLLNNPGPLPLKSYEYLVESYRQRLNDPHIGDKVEVAWRGKFRLETQDVYQGLAWWVAEVVDKHSDVGRYKIRYPGWDSRWDEWVPRSRLRWKVSRNDIESIRVGDVVELWCCGASVPGAWLETKVRRVRHGRYCLGKVISSGLLWVDRDRLRLVSRPSLTHSSEPIDGHQVTDRRRRYSFMSSALAYAGNFLSSSRNLDDDADNDAADPPTPRGACSIM